MKYTGVRLLPVVIVWLFMLESPTIASSDIVIYTLSNDSSQLSQMLSWNIPYRKWIDLGGQWYVKNPDTNVVIGTMNVPFSFTGKQSLYIENDFYFVRDKKSRVFLNLEWVCGALAIFINDHELYNGKECFIPLKLPIAEEMLLSGENRIKILITPLQNKRGEIPGWMPINQPLTDSGIFGSIYLEKVPNFNIESINIDTKSINSSINIEGSVVLSDSIRMGQGIQLEVSYYDTENLLLQVPLNFQDSLQIEFQFPGISLNTDSLWKTNQTKKLWVEVKLDSSGKTVDLKRQLFSGNQFQLNKQQFFLNNQPLTINGINYVYQNPDGRSLFNLELIKRDLNWIKRSGFNVIRVIMHPLPERFYRLCDEFGLLCFQDLPIYLMNKPVESREVQFREFQRQYEYLLNLSRRHPSIAAAGIAFQFDGRSKWQSERLVELLGVIEKLKLPLYLSTPIPHSDSFEKIDFQIVDMLSRTSIEREFERFEGIYGENAFFPSAYSKGLTHRVDSTTVIEALIQITSLYEEVRLRQKQGLINGHFILTYNNFLFQLPSLQNGSLPNPYLNNIGMVDLNRNPRIHFKYAEIDTLVGTDREALVVSEAHSAISYIYVILGLLNLFLFLVFYRQFLEFRLNLHYSLKKPHGFFINLQERIIIPHGQSLLLIFVVSLNGAIIWSSLGYYFRNNLLLDYLTSIVFFSPDIKLSVIQLVWNQINFLIFGTILSILIFMILSIIIKLVSLFGNSRVQFSQALAVSAWSGVPFIFLLPVGVVMYNLLIAFKSYWIMLFILLYFHFWFILRWINGTRVLTDRLYSRIFAFFIILVLVSATMVIYFYQQKINLFEHLKFVYHLYTTSR